MSSQRLVISVSVAFCFAIALLPQPAWAAGLDVFAVGNGGIIHSGDLGGSWQVQNSTPNLRDVKFIDSNNGWAVGLGGTILHTSNGGVNWALQTSGVTSDLLGVDFITTSAGFSGFAVGAGGVILGTTNGGTTWTPQSSPTTSMLNSVSLHSVNGGGLGVHLDAGIAVGAGGALAALGGGPPLIWTANNSGTTNDLHAVYLPAVALGYAVGDAGTLRKETTSPGGTWFGVTTNTTEALYGVDFSPAFDHGLMVGSNGTILQASAVNGPWTSFPSGVTATLRDVDFGPDANQVYVVGSGGTILSPKFFVPNRTIIYTGVPNDDLYGVSVIPEATATGLLAPCLIATMRRRRPA